MGIERSTKVILISHGLNTAWIDTLRSALETAFSVPVVHLDGDYRHSLDQRLAGPALIMIYDTDFARILETVQRWHRRHADTPLLVVSPEQDEDRLVRIYHAGADECIHTDVGLPLLLAKLRVWMRWVIIGDSEPNQSLTAG